VPAGEIVEAILDPAFGQIDAQGVHAVIGEVSHPGSAVHAKVLLREPGRGIRTAARHHSGQETIPRPFESRHCAARMSGRIQALVVNGESHMRVHHHGLDRRGDWRKGSVARVVRPGDDIPVFLRRRREALDGNAAARPGVKAVDDRPCAIRRVFGRHVQRIALPLFGTANDSFEDLAALDLLRRNRQDGQRPNGNQALHLLGAAASMVSASFLMPAGIPASSAGPMAA
jgi:hypothetical protein